MKDSEGNKIKAGDTIVFSYGIPPLRVEAEVVIKRGLNNKPMLYALTAGHTPAECELNELMKYVGYFYKKETRGA